MTDWATIANVGTAGATLVLAVATFASVRSGNRTARAAEQGVQVGLRPLLTSSRVGDPPEKVGFMDDHWTSIPGGHGEAHVGDEAIYLAMTLRNVGQGIAVLDGWRAFPDRLIGEVDHAPPATFRRLTRDLFVPPGDRGFWQGALRDPSDEAFEPLRRRIVDRQPLSVELLYFDDEGGQRAITRFALTPLPEGDGWLVAASRHWNLDRSTPR
jgi:hypothetical protein